MYNPNGKSFAKGFVKMWRKEVKKQNIKGIRRREYLLTPNKPKKMKMLIM